jgi:hypothetical protein
MRETHIIESFEASIIDSNGEIHPIEATKEISNKYYSIRRLNLKICYEDFIEVQSKLCRSSKDILIFGHLFQRVDKENELRVNITKFCEQYNYTRSRVNKMLQESIEINFIKRLDRGIYLINPFIFKSKGCSNQTIERLQKEWHQIL